MVRTSRARKVMGVSSWTSEAELRQRYHQLAKRLHPDAGGDAEAFVELQAAFAELADEPAPSPMSPSWGSQTPSQKTVDAQRAVADRRQAAEPAAPAVDVSTVDWTAEVRPGSLRLDALARAILACEDGTFRARSRGPKGSSGRLASLLDDSLTTLLMITPLGRPTGEIVLTAHKRGPRTMLLDGKLPAGWVARRTNSDEVVARRDVAPIHDDAQANALRHALVTQAALDALSWPLGSWST